MSRYRLSLLAIAALAVPASAINITFDYSKDTTNFFDANKKAILNQAALAFVGFSDSLAAINPSVAIGNTYTSTFSDPTTNLTDTISNISFPANTLTIYVGARDLGAGVLGLGGPPASTTAFYSDTTFRDAVLYRGQFGATNASSTSTDFGAWGGTISFSSTANFYYGSSVTGLGATQSDFLSVATHELGHVLGFGTANSFNHYVSSTSFTGPNAKAAHSNANVPLDAGRAHFADGTMSTLDGFRSQETEMDPSLTQGTRKYFTDLDYAVLKDVGWQVRKPGDANGDGIVNSDDYALIDRGFDKHLSGWTNGDFNNDGSITSSDYTIIDRAFINQTHTLDPSFLADRETTFGPDYVADLLSTVPEPSSLLAACGLALPLFRRTRR